jgi:glycosyltransferase involved in cell wall biosynthesis
MRLNWFSPLPPERSDIAHYTARLAPALMRNFEVRFWTTYKEVHSLPRGAKIRIYDPTLIEERECTRDLVKGINIYNFGNDIRFHNAIYRVAQYVPGIAVLHDTRLHHFIFAYYRPGHPEWERYVRLAVELYGETGAKKAREITDSHGKLIDAHLEEMPFVEPFLANAIGAICHSKSACADVKQRSSVSTLELPLPFASLAQTPRVKRVWSPPFRLIMFGYFGSNRRVAEILAALKDVRGEIDFHLDFFGIPQNKAEIENMIGALDLRDRVVLHGFVSEQALDNAIAAAHLAFNLRHPTMGEASGGILRSWVHATPTLVTNAGWYADLPDGIVRKISIENERADLVQALKDLASNPKIYQALGNQAKEFALTNHHPTGYAERLAHALADVPELLARFAANQGMHGVARQARSANERAIFLERAAPQIASLFG